jgi:mutator protein MutT
LAFQNFFFFVDMDSSEKTFPRPIVGCLAVVRRGDKILLVQRAKLPGIGKWGFPGGHLEMGETVRECAVRELREETGIAADAVSVLTAFDFITRDEAGLVARHYTLIAILCNWCAGDGELLEDASSLGWFTVAEAERLDTFPDALPAMRLALTKG